MAKISKYYMRTSSSDNLDSLDFGLNYGSVSMAGHSIPYNGSAKTGSAFVAPGFSHDLANTVAGVANPSASLAGAAANTPNSGASSYSDAGVASALAVIRDAAQNNTATHDTPAVSDYADAGVTGVSTSNLGAINSALNSGPINGAAADTTAEVQAIVNAYQAILNSADGTAGNTTTPLSFAQYAAIGVAVPNGPALGGGGALHLLNDVLDGKLSGDVDTVSEVQALVDAANHVAIAAGGSVADIAALTLADLQILGVTGVTADNLAAARIGVGIASADMAVDTLAHLQKVISDTIQLFPPVPTPVDGISVIKGGSFVDTGKTAILGDHTYEVYHQGNFAHWLIDPSINHTVVM